MRIFLSFSLLVTCLLSSLAFGGIKNLGLSQEGLYRGGKLHGGKADFKELKRLGVDTIINVAVEADNEELCSQYKMKCIHKPAVLVPWFDIFQTTPPTLIESFWIVKNLLENNHKVYVHCRMGSDRTGTLIAALEMNQMRREETGVLSQNNLNRIFSNLHKYKYNQAFFPGVKLRIHNWAKKAPRWFYKNPLGS